MYDVLEKSVRLMDRRLNELRAEAAVQEFLAVTDARLRVTGRDGTPVMADAQTTPVTGAGERTGGAADGRKSKAKSANGAAGSDARGARQTQCLAVVDARPGVTIREMSQAAGISYDNGRRVAARLADKGLVVKRDGGLYVSGGGGVEKAAVTGDSSVHSGGDGTSVGAGAVALPDWAQ
jgi:hypothetical protein